MKKLLFTLLLPVLSIFAVMAQSIEVDVIKEASELDLSAAPISVKPGSGIFVAYGNRIAGVDTVCEVGVNLPENVVIEDFVFAGPSVVMKINGGMAWTRQEGGFDACAFPEEGFRLCPATDSTVYVLGADRIIEYDLKNKKPRTMVNVAGTPVAAHYLPDGFVLATDRAVYSLINGEWKLLHSHPGRINAAVVMPAGIFVGSDQGLWRLAGDDVMELIGMGGVRKLLVEGMTLYVVDGEGNLVGFTFES